MKNLAIGSDQLLLAEFVNITFSSSNLWNKDSRTVGLGLCNGDLMTWLFRVEETVTTATQHARLGERQR
jgi:hypothetical protein